MLISATNIWWDWALKTYSSFKYEVQIMPKFKFDCLFMTHTLSVGAMLQPFVQVKLNLTGLTWLIIKWLILQFDYDIYTVSGCDAATFRGTGAGNAHLQQPYLQSASAACFHPWTHNLNSIALHRTGKQTKRNQHDRNDRKPNGINGNVRYGNKIIVRIWAQT